MIFTGVAIHAGQGYKFRSNNKIGCKYNLFLAFACDPTTVSVDEQVTGLLASQTIHGNASLPAFVHYLVERKTYNDTNILQLAPGYEQLLKNLKRRSHKNDHDTIMSFLGASRQGRLCNGDDLFHEFTLAGETYRTIFGDFKGRPCTYKEMVNYDEDQDVFAVLEEEPKGSSEEEDEGMDVGSPMVTVVLDGSSVEESSSARSPSAEPQLRSRPRKHPRLIYDDGSDTEYAP